MEPSLSLLVRAEEPYPPVAVQNPNMLYARAMLDNMGGIRSEMSAVSLYFYDSLVTAYQRPEFSELFHRINVVEMHHLEIFGELALLLGENPRLWAQSGTSKKYWSPAYNQYSLNMRNLVKNAILAEQAAIEKYTKQARSIGDPNIVHMLNRIIQDEEIHLAIFNHMMESLDASRP